MTAHFIDVGYEFRSISIGLERLRGSHTATNLADVTVDVLKRFSLEKSIRAITCDNASVNSKLMKELEKRLVSFNCTHSHIRCMAHIINLAAQKLLSHLTVLADEDETSALLNDGSTLPTAEIPHVFACVRSIIRKIRQSPLLKEKLEFQVRHYGLPSVNLVLDMRVRWNSTFLF